MTKVWKIAAISGNRIICNFGSDDFDEDYQLLEGDILYVHSSTAVVIRDPDSKTILDSWFPYQGSIRIVEVRPRITICDNDNLHLWTQLFGSLFMTNAKVGDLVGVEETRAPLTLVGPPTLKLVEAVADSVNDDNAD